MKFLFSLFILAVFLASQAQLAQSQIGAPAAAMAYTSLCNTDVFSAHNNIAATAFVLKNQIGVYQQNRFLLAELNQTHLAFILQKEKRGSFSSSLGFMGYNSFYELSLSLGYARKFGEKISSGLKLNLHQIAIKENGSKHLISAQLGLKYTPINKIDLALVINNPIRQRITSNSKESLPSNISIACTYHPYEKLLLSLQFTKDLQYPMQASFGMAYHIHPILMLRLGAAVQPMLVSGGIGLQLNNLNIDISSTWDQKLLYSPQISLQYAFGKETN